MAAPMAEVDPPAVLCPRRRTARPALRHWHPDLIPMTFLPVPWHHPFARTDLDNDHAAAAARAWRAMIGRAVRIGGVVHSVPGVVTISPWYLRTLAQHLGPVPDQAIEHRSSGHPAVITGAQLSAIAAKPSTATAAQTSNPHSRPGAHRLPAGYFFGGFRTPALGSAARVNDPPASETLHDSGHSTSNTVLPRSPALNSPKRRIRSRVKDPPRRWCGRHSSGQQARTRSIARLMAAKMRAVDQPSISEPQVAASAPKMR